MVTVSTLSVTGGETGELGSCLQVAQGLGGGKMETRTALASQRKRTTAGSGRSETGVLLQAYLRLLRDLGQAVLSRPWRSQLK